MLQHERSGNQTITCGLVKRCYLLNLTEGLKTILIANMAERIYLVVSLAFLLALMSGTTLIAQGLDAQETIETIVGSQVETTEEAAATDEAGIVAAIEQSLDNAAEIRKRFSLDNVRIVFLPDLEDKVAAAQTPVGVAMQKYSSEITRLREDIQGSAIFYHAINSRSILLNDIIAVQFGDKNDVTILVAGRER